MAFLFSTKAMGLLSKEDYRMAKGGHRRPVKRGNKTVKRENRDEAKILQRAKSKKKQERKSKTVLRQMRGMKWDEEEYSDEMEELDDVVE